MMRDAMHLHVHVHDLDLSSMIYHAAFVLSCMHMHACNSRGKPRIRRRCRDIDRAAQHACSSSVAPPPAAPPPPGVDRRCQIDRQMRRKEDRACGAAMTTTPQRKAGAARLALVNWAVLLGWVASALALDNGLVRTPCKCAARHLLTY